MTKRLALFSVLLLAEPEPFNLLTKCLMALVSPGVVRPPITFRVFFTLFSASDEVIESFEVEMHP